MKNGKIYVAGIGPGCEDDITPAVKKAVLLVLFTNPDQMSQQMRSGCVLRPETQ